MGRFKCSGIAKAKAQFFFYFIPEKDCRCNCSWISANREPPPLGSAESRWKNLTKPEKRGFQKRGSNERADGPRVPSSIRILSPHRVFYVTRRSSVDSICAKPKGARAYVHTCVYVQDVYLSIRSRDIKVERSGRAAIASLVIVWRESRPLMHPIYLVSCVTRSAVS